MVSTRTLIYAAIAVSLSLFILWALCLITSATIHDMFNVYGPTLMTVSTPFYAVYVFISRKFYLYIKSLLGFKFANEQ